MGDTGHSKVKRDARKAVMVFDSASDVFFGHLVDTDVAYYYFVTHLIYLPLRCLCM